MTIEEVQQHFSGKQHQLERHMSNFDHSIDEGLEAELKAEPTSYAEYSGWNFHGEVFYKDEEFHCVVMQYHEFQEIITAKSLEEIMTICCEKYGAE